MCDLLKKSALAYQALAEYEYTLVCGRKGVLTSVTILFPINAYHHLAGFQHSEIFVLTKQSQSGKDAVRMIRVR